MKISAVRLYQVLCGLAGAVIVVQSYALGLQASRHLTDAHRITDLQHSYAQAVEEEKQIVKSCLGTETHYVTQRL